MSKKLLKIKLSQAWQGFHLRMQSRRLSPHTISDYEVTIRKFMEFMEEDPFMEYVTSRHIEGFMAAQTHVTKKTLLNYHTGLCAFWTWAVKEQVVTTHVPHLIEAPTPEITEIVPYTEAEMRLMLNCLNRSKAYKRQGQKIQDRGLIFPERNRALIMLLLDTGVRAEEVCSIKLHDLDKRNNRIKVFGKGAKERYVSFSARTAQAIWRYLATREDANMNEPLFINPEGKAIKRRRLLRILQNIGERAGVPNVTVHRFRHTFATQYLRNRGDPYTLQKMLGHSTLEMVRRYLSIVQNDIERAHQLASPVENWTL